MADHEQNVAAVAPYLAHALAPDALTRRCELGDQRRLAFIRRAATAGFQMDAENLKMLRLSIKLLPVRHAVEQLRLPTQPVLTVGGQEVANQQAGDVVGLGAGCLV